MIAAMAILASAFHAASSGEVQPRLRTGTDGTILLDGRPWRGIGVNFFDAFIRTLRDSSDTSFVHGFRVLDSLGIPFARLSMCGFNEKDMRLYEQDKSAYFKRMDAVVSAARKWNIGLVPSLIWTENLPARMMRQPFDSLTDTNSASARWAKDYVREVVSRYRSETSIWVWEIGNEYYPFGDLPESSRSHNPMTTTATVSYLQMLASAVRQLDPIRPITSGNQRPVDHQYHRAQYRLDTSRSRSMWQKDDYEEHKSVLRTLHPAPIGILSTHVYGFRRLGGWTGKGLVPPHGEVEYFSLVSRIGRELGMPVFLGEFGVDRDDMDSQGVRLDSIGQRALFTRFVDGIVASGIPLSALWVFDASRFIKDFSWDVTPWNARAYQLELIAEANRKMGGSKVDAKKRQRP